MRRFPALVLALALLLTAAGGEAPPGGERDARLHALEVFRVCAFSSEYLSGGRDFLVRWEDPFRVFAAGEPDRHDLRLLADFLGELRARVPGLPEISLAESEDGADIVLRFCPYGEMADAVPGYVPGNAGYFFFRYDSRGAITDAVIAVATDVGGRAVRNQVIREELVGALGLANDHTADRDSILYEGPSDAETLSELDWMMLEYLYSPAVRPGERWDAVERELRRQYGL